MPILAADPFCRKVRWTFMKRRFDREQGNVRHHIQVLCAMAHLQIPA